MRPTTRSIFLMGVATLGLGLVTSPAQAQSARSGGYATSSAAWARYSASNVNSAATGYALNSTGSYVSTRPILVAQPTVPASSGWAGYAPGTAWSGYVPGTAWVSYSPRVGRVRSSVSHYRELGTGRAVALRKPWLPGSP